MWTVRAAQTHRVSASLSVFTLYADPAAAVRWLVEALGFVVVNSAVAGDEQLLHAELRLGEAVVIVERASEGQAASPVVDRSTSRAPVLCLDDAAAVDAAYERAVAAGSTTLREPEDTPWGNHRFEVLDPEGHQWSVGSYTPGRPWS
ncbi:glyoxalase [Marmoricola endophyticus]|uniref:Glyoxalase n=1 Tax=Marmoricola endophyticus TaxID=2040280 RepID=A0A917BBQ7_9ACTN|nr:glyoxalase [Marmoricola endophyticus]